MPFSPANRALNQAEVRPLAAAPPNHRQNIADFLNHISKREILRMISATAVPQNVMFSLCDYYCRETADLVQC